MKLTIERNGGLVGRKAMFSAEVDSLSAPQQKALMDLLASPPENIPSPGADRFHFKVSVDIAGVRRECEVPEHAMPEVLAGLPKIEI